MMAKVHRVLDSMIGVHLNAHVMSEYLSVVSEHRLKAAAGGYEFLMQNCERSSSMSKY